MRMNHSSVITSSQLKEDTECSPEVTSPKSARRASFPRFRRRKSTDTASSIYVAEEKSPKAAVKAGVFRRQKQSAPPATDEAEGERREGPASNGSTIRTSILGSYVPLEEPLGEVEPPKEPEQDEIALPAPDSCATAVLQHSFWLCGASLNDYYNEDPPEFNQIPDDPTVQESFECVFASQLEEGLPHELLWEEDVIPASASTDSERRSTLVSPAVLHQSLLKTRRTSPTARPVNSTPKKTFRTGALVHIGTYDPIRDLLSLSPPHHKQVEQPKAQCSCATKSTPSVPPQHWPQKPLLVRATPNSGMRIRGIRFVAHHTYLWEPGDAHSWMSALHQHWGTSANYVENSFSKCPECMLLPINNGNEPPGESLVVDFTSDLWEGTLLLRIRNSQGTTKTRPTVESGYFHGVNRRYQMVISGRPLKELNMNDLVSGFQLQRPFGKMPPKWILKGGLKLLSFFAPQLEAQLDGQHPTSFAPLGSTPQCVLVDAEVDIEHRLQEPAHAQETLLGVASDAPTTLARARFRKKAFDKLCMQGVAPTLSPEKTYVFEFLQHLVNFNEFELELGSMFGSISLVDALDGQALPVMAVCRSTGERLWSFDIFHQGLIPDSKRHDEA